MSPEVALNTHLPSQNYQPQDQQQQFQNNQVSQSQDMEQQHTYLEEKYVQEAEANATAKPKFMHKVVRGFAAGKGPSAVHNPKNYNQKLTNFIEDALYESEERPQKFPLLIETYYQENLLKRFNLIKYLKAEIRKEKAKNFVKRKIMEEQKSKTEQRNLSKTLVNNFKDCIDQVLREK